MRHPHFYAAISRLGLINLPYGATEFNLGVEDGPDVVLSNMFLNNFQNPTVTPFRYSLPEGIRKDQYMATLARESQGFAQLINNTLQPQETQVVIGGDHSVAYGSVRAILARHQPEQIGYVQFDSHSDMSDFGDSPSGNFHGMFLRALLDPDFDAPELRLPLGQTLLPANTMMFGNLEPDDFEFIEDKKIKFASSQLLESAAERHVLEKDLATLCQRVQHLHVSFDIDVFDASLVSATGTPNSWGGLTKAHVWPLLEQLATHPSVSIDLVEVNPRKKGSEATVQLAQEVLGTLLSIPAK